MEVYTEYLIDMTLKLSIHTQTYPYLAQHSKWGHKCLCCVKNVAQVYQSEDNLALRHTKWGYFFDKPMPNKVRIWFRLHYTPPIGRIHEVAICHLTRYQILTSLCQNVLNLTVLYSISTLLWMPVQTPLHSHPDINTTTHTSPFLTHPYSRISFLPMQWGYTISCD